MSTPTTSESVIAELVTTMRALAGSHPGFRPAHAKGIVCSGTFRASTEARRISRASHLQGAPLAAVIRFANASGDPNVHDGQPGVRSLAVKFQLSGGANADILANSIEGFPARTPEEFLAFLKAQLPDPATGKPSPDAVPRFLQNHPAARAFVERLMKKPVPASYARETYHAEHAFRFTAADGTSRFGRYRWIPEAGDMFLSPDEAGQRSPNFLRDELESRLRNGPAVFRLHLQLAAPNDPTDDVTALWPDDRPLTELGRLEVTAISPTSAADEQRLVFDPANRTDGIDLSADPILLARSAAYSISYDRRSKGE
ncbi:MAG TPA: catalase family peroxidase [Candidatus Methylomirabilis sp.]|nr:catalase family peroxidase [Candidatus Methylomirabilis sp.]